MPTVRVLVGLPPYGETAVPIPAEWGRAGREGLVVGFSTDTGDTWVGNFRPGLGGLDAAYVHPNGQNVLVIAAGAAWLVDPNDRTAAEISDGIDATWWVSGPEGLVLSCQGLAFFRLGPGGTMWHMRRISWDGFKDVQVSSSEIRGLAWAPWDPEWTPFSVDLQTGRVEGGQLQRARLHSGGAPGQQRIRLTSRCSRRGASCTRLLRETVPAARG